MRKIFTFMLLAAALLVSVPSSAYVPGEERNLGYYNLPLIGHYGNTNDFGTICVPHRIVATLGITIYDVLCVDVVESNPTQVVRLVVDVHKQCNSEEDQLIHEPWPGGRYADNDAEPFCPKSTSGSESPCGENSTKTYIDWLWDYNPDETVIETWVRHDYRMVAGAAYFYTVCKNVDSLKDRRIYVDLADSATAPVCVNGFYGTFEETKINTPITVLAKNSKGLQYLAQIPSATMPAHRGYFKGNFDCVPYRYNTDSIPEDPNPHPSSAPNPIHYPCSDAPTAPRRVSSNAIAFNVGPRDAATGLYPIDFEHPIYLNQEPNKRIENGQLIIEAADGTKYNAFGQRVE